MWLTDDGFMWTETCWSSFYNFIYFNNLRILCVCISWTMNCLKYKISWISLLWGAELFHMDGRTHLTGLIVAFRNFANAPKTATFWLQRELTWYLGQTVAPYIIEWISIPRRCVYCAVRTKYLNLLQVNFLRTVLSHSINQRCIVIWVDHHPR